MEFIRETGHKELQLGSDNEPAILALKQNAIQRIQDFNITPIEAQTGDHQSNGEGEVAVEL
eukprot:841638-Karenia_brevis.AAC.1